VTADVLVVGSGPSGAQAAKKASDLGLAVTMVDVGHDDPDTRGAIPAGTFSSLRRTDAQQRRYFAGEFDAESLAAVRVGAQLTPPRQFITRDTERLTPLESATFTPLQSLALGGLGAGWGAGAVTFEHGELRRAGLPPDEMRAWYDEVAADIGISADPNDDVAGDLARFSPVEPALELDTNAAALMRTYAARRDAVHRAGLRLGRTPLAMLSRPRGEGATARSATALDDMDFYSDATRSVYRPRYTVEELRGRASFTYLGGTLARRFVPTGTGVELECVDVHTGAPVRVAARRAILAAGALGTTRIVLASLNRYDVRVPLLANPYRYMPCVNLAMFGRPAADRRHSLSQLIGLLDAGHGDDVLYLSLYSYRSLLLYKLIKEMPLPPRAGLLVARLLMSSLTVVGVNLSDGGEPHNWCSLRRDAGGTDVLVAQYAPSADERERVARGIRRTRRALMRLRCVPFAVIDPGHGSSIHYAGGLRITPDRADVLGTDASGRLHAAPDVYVADSANWTFLPAKGPTLTMMANARRVAHAAARELGAAV
jgi:choline dehydrogenase-like flavoprotein